MNDDLDFPSLGLEKDIESSKSPNHEFEHSSTSNPLKKANEFDISYLESSRRMLEREISGNSMKPPPRFTSTRRNLGGSHTPRSSVEEFDEKNAHYHSPLQNEAKVS